MGFEKFGSVSYVSQTKVSKFIEFLEKKEIVGTRCVRCGSLEFPPRAFCRQCLSNKWEWISLSGYCKLITFTKVEAAPAAFKAEAPYLLGLAKFSEGPQVFAWIDKEIPESLLKVGMSLKLEPCKLTNGNYSYILTSTRAE